MAYVVAAKWTVGAENLVPVSEAIGKLAMASRAELGNLVYQVHRDPTDPSVFFMYEQYTDEAAFQAHVASPHFQLHCIQEAVPLLETRARDFYETWEPDGDLVAGPTWTT